MGDILDTDPSELFEPATFVSDCRDFVSNWAIPVDADAEVLAKRIHHVTSLYAVALVRIGKLLASPSDLQIINRCFQSLSTELEITFALFRMDARAIVAARRSSPGIPDAVRNEAMEAIRGVALRLIVQQVAAQAVEKTKPINVDQGPPSLSDIEQEIVDAIRSAARPLRTIDEIAAATVVRRDPDSNFRTAIAGLKRRGIIDKSRGDYVLLPQKMS